MRRETEFQSGDAAIAFEAEEEPVNLLVVLGMHRSGTSALAGLLHAAGAVVAQDLVDDQPEINAKGFWEDSRIVAINDQLLADQQRSWFDWQEVSVERLLSAADGKLGEEATDHLRECYLNRIPAVCKDPRFCRTLPFWRRCMARVGLRPLYLLTLRHPNEVAASLYKRDRLPHEYGTLLWMIYTLDAVVAALEGEQCLVFDYAQVLASPPTVVARIARAAGSQAMETSATAVSQAVDVQLRHHTGQKTRLLLPDLQRHAEALYHGLLEYPGGGWRDSVTEARSFVVGNQRTWSLVGGYSLDAMRQQGEMIAIGEQHQHALDMIGEKDRDIATLADEHKHALDVIGEKDRDIATLADEHELALATIERRDSQLQEQISWREHLELELRKHQEELAERRAELAELRRGLLALPVRLRESAKCWMKSR